MKIDVCCMTYNSARYLDDSLRTVLNVVPCNRLIIVDHYSEDDTVKIAKKYGAEIHLENEGLAYARQLAIDQVDIPVFWFHDSDVVYLPPFNWFHKALSLIKGNIASVVACTETQYPTLRGKYCKFWWDRIPMIRVLGFTTGSTLILKEALRGIHIPFELDAREDRYIELYMLKRGWKYDFVKVKGIHYFDHAEKKGAWGGANERILTGSRSLPYLLARRVLSAPLKGFVAGIGTKDARVFTWNTKHWFGYLDGFLHPEKYRRMKRGVTKD